MVVFKEGPKELPKQRKPTLVIHQRVRVLDSDPLLDINPLSRLLWFHNPVNRLLFLAIGPLTFGNEDNRGRYITKMIVRDVDFGQILFVVFGCEFFGRWTDEHFKVEYKVSTIEASGLGDTSDFDGIRTNNGIEGTASVVMVMALFAFEEINLGDLEWTRWRHGRSVHISRKTSTQIATSSHVMSKLALYDIAPTITTSSFFRRVLSRKDGEIFTVPVITPLIVVTRVIVPEREMNQVFFHRANDGIQEIIVVRVIAGIKGLLFIDIHRDTTFTDQTRTIADVRFTGSYDVLDLALIVSSRTSDTKVRCGQNILCAS